MERASGEALVHCEALFKLPHFAQPNLLMAKEVNTFSSTNLLSHINISFNILSRELQFKSNRQRKQTLQIHSQKFNICLKIVLKTELQEISQKAKESVRLYLLPCVQLFTHNIDAREATMPLYINHMDWSGKITRTGRQF